MGRAFLLMALSTLMACGAARTLASASLSSSVDWRSASAKEVPQPDSRRVRNLTLRSSRSAEGRPSPTFPQGTSRVFASFELTGVQARARVRVHWRHEGRELGRNDLVATEQTRTLTAELASDAALPTGDYVVDVRVAGLPEARTTFRIAEGSSAEEGTEPNGPDVSALRLSTDQCVPSEEDEGEEAPSFGSEVRQVWLCLIYEHVDSGQELEVRWRRCQAEVMAATTFSPEGSGELSASFTHEPSLPPGEYRAEIILDGREVARAPFVVRR